jgi:hypothetical protein
MKNKVRLILFLLGAFSFSSGIVRSACPEQPKDDGVCDTLNLIPTGDTLCRSFPALVRVPLWVTHDLVRSKDSLVAFIVPLCYTHTNPSVFCSVSSYWNRTLWSSSNLPRSIFRHLVVSPSDTVHNWMMDLFDAGNGEEWNTIILDADGISHSWLTLIASGSEDVRFGSANRTLLATITFRVQDTMHICVDSCFLFPEDRLSFTDSSSNVYIPRHNLPVCFRVDTAGSTSGVRDLGDSDDGNPDRFSLPQNYPNPFNPTTTIRFSLNQTAEVSLEVFNLLGQKVKTLLNGQRLSPGTHAVDWDGTAEDGKTVSAGVYLYRIQAGDFGDAKKMVFLK